MSKTIDTRSLRPGQRIGVTYPGRKSVELYCEVRELTEEHAVASVINGAWTALLRYDGLLVVAERASREPLPYAIAYAGRFPTPLGSYGDAIEFMDRQIQHSRLWLWAYDRLLEAKALCKQVKRVPKALAAAKEAFGDSLDGRYRRDIYNDEIPF